MISLKKHRPWVVLFLGLCLAQGAWAQTDEAPNDSTQRFNGKWAIYGGTGFAVFDLYFTGTLYVEGIHLERERLSSFVKGGVGGYAAWAEGGSYVLAQYGVLLGAKKHHLEMSAGPMYFIPSPNTSLSGYVSGALGYRYQKLNEGPWKLIIRAGVAWPETFYSSIGISF